MTYRLLADLVVIMHLLFVLFVLLGGFLVYFRKQWAWLHVPAFIWAAVIEFGGWICPLTPLEIRLRTLGEISAYEGGFIEHYILPVLYPAALTRNMQIWLGVIVLVINITAYALVLQKHIKGNKAPLASNTKKA